MPLAQEEGACNPHLDLSCARDSVQCGAHSHRICPLHLWFHSCPTSPALIPSIRPDVVRSGEAPLGAYDMTAL